MSKEKEMIEFAFDKIEQYFDAAKLVIDQYGGDVADLALAALRIEAASTLATPLLLLLLAYFLYRVAKRIYGIEKDETGDGQFTLMFGTPIIAALFVLGVFKLINVWAWVGIFYPELYAVHKFLL
jgi:hypothetical protein